MKLIKSPKETALACMFIGSSMAKCAIVRKIFLGMFAGIASSVGCLASTSTTLAIQSTPEATILNYGAFASLVVGLIYPISILGDIFFGTVSFSSNTMFLSVAGLARFATVFDLLMDWLVVYFSNYLGSILTAGLCMAGMFEFDEASKSAFIFLADSKSSLAWHEVFLRGIASNVLISISIFCTVQSEHWTSIVTVSAVGVIAGLTVKSELSTVNQFIFMVALMLGETRNFWRTQWANLLPSALGNMVAGILIGSTIYFLYLHGIVIPRKPQSKSRVDNGEKIPAGSNNNDNERNGMMRRAMSWCRIRLRLLISRVIG